MVAACRLAGALYMVGTLALSDVDASFTNNSAGANGGSDKKGRWTRWTVANPLAGCFACRLGRDGNSDFIILRSLGDFYRAVL